MVKKYIPQKGDIVVLSLSPQSGHEQKGRRPALIVSNFLFNKATKMAFACPITSVNRNFPFHIPVSTKNVEGYIMTEQVKSLDIFSRDISFIEKVNPQILGNVLGIMDAIIGDD